MDIQLLQKYNKPGPRYTSYPPATFFHSELTDADYKRHILASNNEGPGNISVYVHIPFCPRFCLFCGCNTSCFPEDKTLDRYINALIREMEEVFDMLDSNRKVSQVHFGGGTPNSIDPAYVERIMDVVKSRFEFTESVEVAMECNPAYLELEHIDRYAGMGFNRLSLGIQDFNEEVLRMVNRKPSKLPVEELVARMKQHNMGVNMDLIYGLPGQTVESYRTTIEKAMSLDLDRLVTFSYAHVPWFKSAQKKLEEYGLPDASQKLSMFEMAYKLLTNNGFASIGMDHYAKKTDELYKAFNQNTLHRNFQGYCTRETTGQVYAFGATSISQLHSAYFQNKKDVDAYIQAVEQNALALERGYELSQEDLIRRDGINQLMCNGILDFSALAASYSISESSLYKVLGFVPESLNEFIEDDLLVFENRTIKLNPQGFFVVRNIAMTIDPLLDQGKGQYSKTV